MIKKAANDSPMRALTQEPALREIERQIARINERQLDAMRQERAMARFWKDKRVLKLLQSPEVQELRSILDSYTSPNAARLKKKVRRKPA